MSRRLARAADRCGGGWVGIEPGKKVLVFAVEFGGCGEAVAEKVRHGCEKNSAYPVDGSARAIPLSLSLLPPLSHSCSVVRRFSCCCHLFRDVRRLCCTATYVAASGSRGVTGCEQDSLGRRFATRLGLFVPLCVAARCLPAFTAACVAKDDNMCTRSTQGLRYRARCLGQSQSQGYRERTHEGYACVERSKAEAIKLGRGHWRLLQGPTRKDPADCAQCRAHAHAEGAVLQGDAWRAADLERRGCPARGRRLHPGDQVLRWPACAAPVNKLAGHALSVPFCPTRSRAASTVLCGDGD
eukprot:140449-Chlamydomonas_euryale.AAC.2